jgi:hypothetical protein
MARKKAARRPAKKSVSRTKRAVFGYPLFIFMMLCAGVFLVTATFPGLADDLHISAKVSAPLVTDPAVINEPADGSHFSTIPVNVSGTCPANAAYVEIYRGSVMSGTAICDTNQTFQMSADLFPGANILTAQVFNMTDDEGPVSDAVNVVYDVPQPPKPTPENEQPAAAGGSNKPASAAASPLMVSTEFVYKGYRLGDLVEWPINISGGRSPYTANIDWGDGSHTDYLRQAAGSFTIAHRYQRLPSSNNSFIIKVSVTDANGGQAYAQFFVLVTSSVTSAPAASIFNKPPPSINNHNWLWIAWPAYGAIMVMTASFWLGEREEQIILNKKGMLKRSHSH